MKTLYIERSIGECRDGKWVESLDLEGVERIVVGTGPGSFAGIRSALAFAQGYALATHCEVLGLPSACAIAAQVIKQSNNSNNTNNQTMRLAVIGDARQGQFWIALFDGFRLEKDIFQVSLSELKGSVPADYRVVTPDAKRIDGLLRETFGERYLGGQTPSAGGQAPTSEPVDMTPTSEGLRLFAEANPSILKPEPLPIYLNPAVR